MRIQASEIWYPLVLDAVSQQTVNAGSLCPGYVLCIKSKKAVNQMIWKGSDIMCCVQLVWITSYTFSQQH